MAWFISSFFVFMDSQSCWITMNRFRCKLLRKQKKKGILEEKPMHKLNGRFSGSCNSSTWTHPLEQMNLCPCRPLYLNSISFVSFFYYYLNFRWPDLWTVGFPILRAVFWFSVVSHDVSSRKTQEKENKERIFFFFFIKLKPSVLVVNIKFPFKNYIFGFLTILFFNMARFIKKIQDFKYLNIISGVTVLNHI